MSDIFKEPGVKDPGHLKRIRQCPCILTGQLGVEAAHISYPDRRYVKRPRGKGEKTHDMFVVPLSPEEHRRQHAMREQDFWRLANVDPVHVAVALYMWSSVKMINDAQKVDYMTKVCVQAGIGMFPWQETDL